jgi:hypothetical protein
MASIFGTAKYAENAEYSTITLLFPRIPRVPRFHAIWVLARPGSDFGLRIALRVHSYRLAVEDEGGGFDFGSGGGNLG